jgi:hypothetical protein
MSATVPPPAEALLALWEFVNKTLDTSFDDLCWRDVFIDMAKLAGREFEPGLLPKPLHMRNCDRFYDSLAASSPYLKVGVDPAAVLALLNTAWEADQDAVHALVINRVPCNHALRDHPTIVVDSFDNKGERPNVGLLGFLNGLLSPDGTVVAMKWSDDADVDGRRTPLGFCLVPFQTLPPGEPKCTPRSESTTEGTS